MTNLWRDSLRVFGLLAALVVASSVYAQDAAETEAPQTVVVIQSALLTVDTDRLFTNSMYGQRIQAEFQQDRLALIAENREIEAQLTEEESDLTNQRPNLSREEFAALAEAFDAKTQRIRTEQAAKDTEIRARPDRARQEFLRIVQDVLVEIMRERRALAILSSDSVLLVADTINITDEAIARIDGLIGDGSN